MARKQQERAEEQAESARSVTAIVDHPGDDSRSSPSFRTPPKISSNYQIRWPNSSWWTVLALRIRRWLLEQVDHESGAGGGARRCMIREMWMAGKTSSFGDDAIIRRGSILEQPLADAARRALSSAIKRSIMTSVSLFRTLGIRPLHHMQHKRHDTPLHRFRLLRLLHPLSPYASTENHQ